MAKHYKKLEDINSNEWLQPDEFGQVHDNKLKHDQRSNKDAEALSRGKHDEGDTAKFSEVTLVTTTRTLLSTAVPIQFREPFIFSHYRLPYKPWIYYLQSAFNLHNETWNIWSHLLPSLFLMMRVVQVTVQYWPYVLTDVTIWPLLCCGLGFSSNLFLSATVHMFISRSEMDHHWFFQLDYLGIALGALSGGIGLHFLAGTQEYMDLFGHWPFYMTVILIQSIVICCSIGKLCYHRPYPWTRSLWNSISCGGAMLVSMIPLWCRLYFYLTSKDKNAKDDLLMKGHIWVPICMVISNVFYVSRLPERFLPGKVDVFLHSHVFFHFFISMAYYIGFESVLKEYHTRDFSERMLSQPTGLSVFGGMFITVIIGCLVIYNTDIGRKKRVKSTTGSNSQVTRVFHIKEIFT